MVKANKKRKLAHMVYVAASMVWLWSVGCKEAVPVQTNQTHAPSHDAGASAQDLDAQVEPDVGVPRFVDTNADMNADMNAPVATDHARPQDVKQAFVALATQIVEPKYHLNDVYPEGVSTWSTACTWTPEPDELFREKESLLIKRACRDLLHTGTISTVLDDKGQGAVVQELWMWDYPNTSRARSALCTMNDMAWGPFNKHPYSLYLWKGTRVLALESRFRFRKYEDELAARIEALEGVETIVCKKTPGKTPPTSD